MDIFERIIVGPGRQQERKSAIATTLARIDRTVLDFIASANIKVYSLNVEANERYFDASAYFKSERIDIDSWAAPPAGLFVVPERTVYLRSTSPMTVAHEVGHAFDLALSSLEQYWTANNQCWKHAFTTTKRLVSEYSGAGTDEAFAEAFRAWWNINDLASPWPNVSREHLFERSPAIHAIIADVLARVSNPATCAA